MPEDITRKPLETVHDPGSGLGDWPKIPDHEVLRCVGSGAYGDVWLARSITGTMRAVKVVSRKRFEDDRPFDREFTGVRNFEPVSRSHDGLVDVLHVGRNDEAGYFYYVMELADAVDESATYKPRTLRAELNKRGRLPVEDCIALGLTLTSALDHLHRHGLIHRDIKLSNIIYIEGVPKLADIGLVAASTDSRSYVGTEGYIPPEGPGTAQADVYSLGKVLYESVTGKDRAQFPELPSRTAEDKRANRLNEIILKACEENVRNRYQSAAEMHADLQALSLGKRPALRRPRRRVALAGLALLVCVGAGLLFFQLNQPPVAVNRISDAGPRMFGYRLEGDEVVFEFDPRDYDFDDIVVDTGQQNRLRSLRGIAVNEVSIPGEFNLWSTNTWQMSRVGDLRFELRKKLDEFSKRPEWQFKFFINNRYWLQVPPIAPNQARDPQGEHINFVLKLRKPEPAPAAALEDDRQSLWDVGGETVITGTSGFGAGAGLNMFGARLRSDERGVALFQDGKRDGFVHFVEWRTPAPVTVNRIQLEAAHDPGSLQRSFRQFNLYAFVNSIGSYEPILTFRPSLPYGGNRSRNHLTLSTNVTSATSDRFRAEFVQNGNFPFSGPRIIELQAFQQTSP